MSWCECSANLSYKLLGDKLDCECGEEWKIFEWNWENLDYNLDVILSNNNRDVLFHPVYSSGTSAVKGNQILKPNLHYYWEIKMLTNLYGTDIMVGIGTSKVTLTDWHLRFCSMLGLDSESWGYSYMGRIQHAKCSRRYGTRFTVGSLIGVHLDMCSGTLEYFCNRQPLGIAFRDLKKHELFPMVCSTAAQSAMRITCATSEMPTLQLECLKFIKRHSKLVRQLWKYPSLIKMVGKKYFWLISKPPAEESSDLELEDEVVLSNSTLDSVNLKTVVSSQLAMKDNAVLFENVTDGNVIQCKRLCTGLIREESARADPDHISYRQDLTIANNYDGNNNDERNLNVGT